MIARSTFGKYVLLRKLATGGMGEVFLAKQRGPSGFEKLLVIKRILAQHHDKNEYLNMFLSEARLVAYLQHANIIQIHEMGQIDGDHFIAMEYVRGKSLRDVIDALRARSLALPLPHVVDLSIKLADGLGYAHEAKDIRARPMNIIHRDINPHNVLVSYNGDLKLIDFGIAKSEMTSVHTATGTIKGKFVYMSPEQSAADPLDKRSDIFSLGIVLYEMTTGENPFVRQNVVLSLEAIQRHPIPPPSAKRPDAAPLDRVLMKALEKRPEDRFQSAYELRDELRALLKSGAVLPFETDLQTFLSELFHADIEEEDRLLAEADRATEPPPLEAVRAEALLKAKTPRPAATMPIRGSSNARGTPKPVTAQPFSDEEVTIAGDEDELAARSRQQSQLPIPPPAEGTGTEIGAVPRSRPPGTPEPEGPLDPNAPHTRKERLPIGPPPSTLRQETAEMPAGDPTPPEASPEDVAALAEPLAAPPPVFSSHFAETKSFRKASASSPPPVPDASSPELPLVPAPTFDAPSGLIPAIGGSARITIAAFVLVFAIAIALGFWGMQIVLAWWTPADPASLAPLAGREPPPLDLGDEPLRPPPPVKPEANPAETPNPPPPEVAKGPAPTLPPAVAPPAAPEPPPAAPAVAPTPEPTPAASSEPRRPRRRPAPPEGEAPAPSEAPAPAAEPARPEPPAAPKPEPVAARPEPPPPAPKAEARRLGVLTIRANPPMAGAMGKQAGTSFQLRDKPATIELTKDGLPTIQLKVHAEAGGVTVTVDSSPWTIVKRSGLSLGKTPQGPFGAAASHELSLLRPGAPPIELSLRFQAGGEP